MYTCIYVYIRSTSDAHDDVCYVCVERIKDGDKDGAEGVLERSVLPRVRPD